VGKPITGIGAGRYRLTPLYLFFEKGTFSTDSQQVPISAVLDVDVKQTMSQKARSVGSITVHIQRSTGVEVVTLSDIANFREGQRLINETAYAARLAIQNYQNTSTVRYSGTLPAGGPVPAASGLAVADQAAPRPDPMEQLKQLGQLHDAGILTEEEFASKKTEILSRL
jgi:hypothetical protein